MQRKPNFELSDGRLQIIFEEIRRDDFVQRAVTIEVDGQREILAIELYDASLGILRWRKGVGVGRLRRWQHSTQRETILSDDHSYYSTSLVMSEAEDTDIPYPIPLLGTLGDERLEPILRDVFMSGKTEVKLPKSLIELRPH